MLFDKNKSKITGKCNHFTGVFCWLKRNDRLYLIVTLNNNFMCVVFCFIIVKHDKKNSC